jgi:hypothetical protein
MNRTPPADAKSGRWANYTPARAAREHFLIFSKRGWSNARDELSGFG